MSKMKLKDIAVEKNERVDNPSESPYSIFVGLEHYDSGEAIIRRHGSTEMLESTMKVFHAGDILVARRNVYLRRAASVDFDGLTSGDSIVLHIENEAYRQIIPFVLNTDDFWNYANQHADGSMSKRLSPKLLMEYEFSVPDEKLEQITEILWAMERTKNAYRELIAKTDELVKSQFIEMFGDPAENPNQHPMKKLSELGELNRGVSKARPRNKPELLGGPYPLVQTGEVSAAGLYIDHYENTYSEEGLAQSKMWPKGTLCITIAANIAQTGILSFDACFPDSVCGFISGNEVTQVYMHYWFSFFQKVLEEQAPQVAQRNINLRILNDLDVMVPPIADQQTFEAFVQQSDKSKFEAQQTLKELTDAQKALMKKIFEQ